MKIHRLDPFAGRLCRSHIIFIIEPKATFFNDPTGGKKRKPGFFLEKTGEIVDFTGQVWYVLNCRIGEYFSYLKENWHNVSNKKKLEVNTS